MSFVGKGSDWHGPMALYVQSRRVRLTHTVESRRGVDARRIGGVVMGQTKRVSSQQTASYRAALTKARPS